MSRHIRIRAAGAACAVAAACAMVVAVPGTASAAHFHSGYWVNQIDCVEFKEGQGDIKTIPAQGTYSCLVDSNGKGYYFWLII